MKIVAYLFGKGTVDVRQVNGAIALESNSERAAAEQERRIERMRNRLIELGVDPDRYIPKGACGEYTPEQIAEVFCPPFENDENGARIRQNICSLDQFLWQTDKGERLYPREMATEHLFYTLRMLYNHSVPPVFRVGQFKRHPNVFKWPLDYKTQAGQAMRAAFNKRNDIEDWMRNELDDMVRNAEFLEAVRDVQSITDYSKRDVDFSMTMPDDKKAKRDMVEARRANAKAKRMRRAVPTKLRGFPGKRCMEHRSYAGLRRPRVECNACAQVFKARKKKRAKAVRHTRGK